MRKKPRFIPPFSQDDERQNIADSVAVRPTRLN